MPSRRKFLVPAAVLLFSVFSAAPALSAVSSGLPTLRDALNGNASAQATLNSDLGGNYSLASNAIQSYYNPVQLDINGNPIPPTPAQITAANTAATTTIQGAISGNTADLSTIQGILNGSLFSVDPITGATAPIPGYTQNMALIAAGNNTLVNPGAGSVSMNTLKLALGGDATATSLLNQGLGTLYPGTGAAFISAMAQTLGGSSPAVAINTITQAQNGDPVAINKLRQMTGSLQAGPLANFLNADEFSFVEGLSTGLSSPAAPSLSSPPAQQNAPAQQAALPSTHIPSSTASGFTAQASGLTNPCGGGAQAVTGAVTDAMSSTVSNTVDSALNNAVSSAGLSLSSSQLSSLSSAVHGAVNNALSQAVSPAINNAVSTGSSTGSSPAQGSLSSSVNGAVANALQGSLGNSLNSAVGNALNGALGSGLNGALGSALNSGAIGSALNGAVSNALNGALGSALGGSLGSALNSAVGGALGSVGSVASLGGGLAPLTGSFATDPCSLTEGTRSLTFAQDYYGGEQLTDYLDDWWTNQFLPRLKMMAAQLNASRIDQSRQLGSMFDSQNITNAARNLQKQQLDARKATAPSELTCTAASPLGAIAQSSRLSTALTQGFKQDLAKRSANAAGTTAETGPAQEQKARWEEYCTEFNDPNGNNGVNVCPKPSTPGPVINEDIDIEGFLLKDTIDMSNPDQYRASVALLKNLVEPKVRQKLPDSVINTSAGEEWIIRQQHLDAIRNVAADVVSSIIARRTGLPPALGPGSGPMPNNPPPTTGASAGDYNAYLAALGMRESSNNYKSINGSNYIGRYQMGKAALIDAGYLVNNGNVNSNNFSNYAWTGKDGINSVSDFLNNPAEQDAAIKTYNQKQWGYITNVCNGCLTQYIGQTINGTLITPSGMIAGAHLVGVGALQKYLQSGGTVVITDGNGTTGTPITQYIANFGGYDTPFYNGSFPATASNAPAAGPPKPIGDIVREIRLKAGVQPCALPITAGQTAVIGVISSAVGYVAGAAQAFINAEGRGIGTIVGTVNASAGAAIATPVRSSSDAASATAAATAAALTPTGPSYNCIAQNPSYNEIMLALTKERFFDPQYFIRMQDDLGAVKQEQTAVNAYISLQYQDIYKLQEQINALLAARAALKLNADVKSNQIQSAPLHP